MTYETYGSKELKHMPYETYENTPSDKKSKGLNDKIDLAVNRTKHLRMNESYRKLHCFHAYRLGVDRFLGLAKEAEQQGKNPARYFTYLLKAAK